MDCWSRRQREWRKLENVMILTSLALQWVAVLNDRFRSEFSYSNETSEVFVACTGFPVYHSNCVAVVLLGTRLRISGLNLVRSAKQFICPSQAKLKTMLRRLAA